MKRALLILPVLLLALAGFFQLRAAYTYWYQGTPNFSEEYVGGPFYKSSYYHNIYDTPNEFDVTNGTHTAMAAYFRLPEDTGTMWPGLYSDYFRVVAESGNLSLYYYTQSGSGLVVPTLIASTTATFGDNSTMRIIENGSLLIVYINNVLKLTADISAYSGYGATTLGHIGYDDSYSYPNYAPTSIAYGPLDSTPPAAIPMGSIIKAQYTNHIDLQWPATTDSETGLFHYELWRNGSLLTTTTSLSYSDTAGITPNTTYNYVLKAVDYHLNEASTTFSVTSAPLTTPTGSPVITSTPDGRRVGVRPTGAYWGAGTENIDVMSGNLNLSLPILSAKARNGWSVPFALSYNSQLWKWASSTNWLYPTGTGYGYGWRLMAGSITPVYSDPYTLDHYVFTDSTGAEYLLNYTFNGAWASTDSIYLYYVPATNRLYFGNGSFWEFDCASASGEVDAGVMYPTLMQDSNGNQITVKYLTGSGASWVNSSSRIDEIDDILDTSGTYTYKFTYTSSLLSKVERPGSSGDSMWLDFTYDTSPQTLVSPFDSTTYGSVTRLLSVYDHAGSRSTSFTYNTAAELTQSTLPYGGRLAYDYTTWTYPDGSKSREVSNRYLYKDYSGGTATTYAFAHETSTTGSVHTFTQLTDPSNVGQKYWEFGQSGAAWGLVTQYEGRDLNSSPTAKVRNEYTWSYDSASINAYISEVDTTKDPSQTYVVQSKTTQAIDNFGNVTSVSIYDYNSLSTPKRTDTYTYGSAAQYNFRLLLTGPNGLAITYDQHDTGAWNSTNTSSYKLWDSTRKGQSDRGLPTTVTKLGSTVNYSYMVAGQPYTVTSNSVTRLASVDVAQNYNVPTQLSISGTTNFDQTIGYNSLQQTTSAQDANSATASSTYDNYGRVTSATSPSGATTMMSYDINGSGVQSVNETAVNGRWSHTYLDGLGRTLKVATGYSTTTVSETDIEYDSCGCSPLGKVKRTSLPHASGATPVWTTNTYDGIGRTLSTSTTGTDTSTQSTYLYQGNTVTVTDAVGNWKKYTTNILGQITQVNEENPAGTGSDYVTTYTYDALGNLTGVSMPRPTGTQTRTFNYNAVGQLTSSVQPETGTTTYTYNSDRTPNTMVDAKGQKTVYSYDSYRRLITVIRSVPAPANTVTVHGSGATSVFYQGDNRGGGSAPYTITLSFNLGTTLDVIDFSGGSATVTNVVINGTTRNPTNVYTDSFNYTHHEFSTSGIADNMSAFTTDYCGYDSYTYDTSPNGKGRLASIVYGRDVTYSWQFCQHSVTDSYEYNTAGGVSKKTVQLKQARTNGSTSTASVSLASTYTYDNEGRTTAIQYPSYWNGTAFVNGPNRGISYDEMGRPKKLTDLTASTDIISGTTYNAASQLLTMTGTGGAPSETRTYNSIGQMVELAQGSLDMQYTYPTSNNNGKILTEKDVVSGETVTYAYDALNRLASATSSDTPGWGQSFGYDGFGNLNSVSTIKGSAPTLSVTYDSATNRRTTDCSDANGNISPCGTPYTFDIANRISSAGGKTYYYGSGNQRVWKGTGTFSSAAGELAFYSATGAKLATYTTAISTSNIRPTSPVYYEYFAGQMLKNSTGWVNQDARGSIGKFYPYGQERPSATTNNKEKFATYYRDTETGLDYAQNRYHSAGDGRFLTPDPSGNGLNWYAYANGDPINNADPSGLCSINGEELGMDPNCSMVVSATDDNYLNGIYLLNGTTLGNAPYLGDIPPGIFTEGCATGLVMYCPQSGSDTSAAPNSPAAIPAATPATAPATISTVFTFRNSLDGLNDPYGTTPIAGGVLGSVLTRGCPDGTTVAGWVACPEATDVPLSPSTVAIAQGVTYAFNSISFQASITVPIPFSPLLTNSGAGTITATLNSQNGFSANLGYPFAIQGGASVVPRINLMTGNITVQGTLPIGPKLPTVSGFTPGLGLSVNPTCGVIGPSLGVPGLSVGLAVNFGGC